MLGEKAEINYKIYNRKQPKKEASARKISFEMKGLCYRRCKDGKTRSIFTINGGKQK